MQSPPIILFVRFYPFHSKLLVLFILFLQMCLMILTMRTDFVTHNLTNTFMYYESILFKSELIPSVSFIQPFSKLHRYKIIVIWFLVNAKSTCHLVSNFFPNTGCVMIAKHGMFKLIARWDQNCMHSFFAQIITMVCHW